MLIDVGKERDRRAPRPGDDDVAEAELIARVRAGERAAEIELFTLHRRQVVATLFRVLGDRDELEDLVQEVFVVAFRRLHEFRGDSRLSTWLYRISVNVALGALRRRRRRPVPVDFDARTDREPEVDPAAGPYEQLASERDRRLCYEILDTLAPKKRLVLYLHEIEGLDLKEVAEILGAHPVTVRTRLYYARREFFRRAAERLARESP